MRNSITFSKYCRGLKIKLQTFPGGTDSRYIRELGIPALGFSPMANTPVLLHDNDEYLAVDTFLKGIEIYKKIIPKLGNACNCAKKKALLKAEQQKKEADKTKEESGEAGEVVKAAEADENVEAVEGSEAVEAGEAVETAEAAETSETVEAAEAGENVEAAEAVAGDETEIIASNEPTTDTRKSAEIGGNTVVKDPTRASAGSIGSKRVSITKGTDEAKEPSS